MGDPSEVRSHNTIRIRPLLLRRFVSFRWRNIFHNVPPNSAYPRSFTPLIAVPINSCITLS